MGYSLPKNDAKDVDFGHPMSGEGDQQKVTLLFTFENVENGGWSLGLYKHIFTNIVYCKYHA